MLVLGLGVGLAGIAAADEPGEETPERRYGTLEEIVVTATKREENVQDVPIAVTAFTPERLDDLQMRDISELGTIVPNLYIGRTDITPSAVTGALRGISFGGVEKSAEGGVSVVLDGVPMGTLAGTAVDAFDIEAVEVLRGPQGTLFGRNTIGGAMLVRRTKPTGEFGVRGKITAGSASRRDANIILNLPAMLDETVSLKLGWSQFLDDGRWRSPVFGEDVGDRDVTRVTATVLWEPTENMDWTLTWEKQRDDSMETPQRHLSSPVGLFGTQFNIGDVTCTTFGHCNWPNVDFGQINNNFAHTDQDFEVQAVTIVGNWDIGEDLTVTSVTGWRYLHERTKFDVDGTPASVFETNRPNEFRQFSEELRATGTLMDGRLNYTGGLFYWNKDSKAEAFLDLLQLCFAPGPACPLALGTDPPTLPTPIAIDPATGQFAYVHAYQKASEDGLAYAVFANVSYDIIPERLTVTVGGRYTRDNKDYSATEGSFIPVGPPGTPEQGLQGIPQVFPGRNPIFNPGFQLGGLGITQPPCPQDTDLCIVGGEGTWREFTPKYGLDWKVTDDILAYASYSVGFRAGGFNERNASPGTIGPFDPEKLKTWEIGFKTSWFDNRLIVNAAYFNEDFVDKLEGVVTLGGPLGTFTNTTNAAEAELEGIEVEITAAPAEFLTLGLNYSWLDGEYKEFDVVIQDQRGGTFIQDNSGNQLANVIPYSISGWAKVATEIGPGVASLFAQYRYRDKAEAATNIDPRSDSPAVYDIDVTAAYDFDYNGKPFRVSAFVRNLTNHEDVGGFLVASPIFVFAPAQFSPPRTWGVELQFAF